MDARCPLCGSVFQTDRTGVQFCPNCGQQVNVADVSGAAPPPPSSGTGPDFGLPPNAPPQSPGARGPTPWERRRELGFFSALFSTLRAVLVSPTNFFDSAQPAQPVWDAIFFAWLMAAIWFVLSIPLSLSRAGNGFVRRYEAFIDRMPNLPPEVRERMHRRLAEALNETAGQSIGKLFGLMLLVMAGVLLWAVIVHLFAMMTGASKNGIGATMRAIGYGCAPLVFAFIPCVNVLAFIYAAAVSIIGLSRLQETTGGRAAAAYLLPTLVFCCCACGCLSMIGVAGAGAFR